MKKLVLSKKDQALYEAINNVEYYWHDIPLPDHEVYPQFSRKLIVTGFSNPDIAQPEDRIYVYVSQVLTIKETGKIYKEIKMPFWMIHEDNREDIIKADGSIMSGTLTTYDDEGNIISEEKKDIKVSSIKYVRFLIKTKSAHLVDVLHKFMGQYIPLFDKEINDI